MKKEEFTIRSLYADDCLDRGPRSQPIQDVSNSHTLNRPCDPEPAANESAARLDKARATDLYIFNFAVRQCSQDLGPTAGDYQKLVLKEGHIIPVARKDPGDWNMPPEIYNIVHGDQGAGIKLVHLGRVRRAYPSRVNLPPSPAIVPHDPAGPFSLSA